MEGRPMAQIAIGDMQMPCAVLALDAVITPR
jgi:hypothetical protein